MAQMTSFYFGQFVLLSRGREGRYFDMTLPESPEPSFSPHVPCDHRGPSQGEFVKLAMQ